MTWQGDEFVIRVPEVFGPLSGHQLTIRLTSVTVLEVPPSTAQQIASSASLIVSLPPFHRITAVEWRVLVRLRCTEGLICVP